MECVECAGKTALMQTAWLSKAGFGLLNNMKFTCIFDCEDIRFKLFDSDIAKLWKPHLFGEFKKS